MEKKCPICNETFECKHDSIENCHCTKVVLSYKTKGYISKYYNDCLCFECLKSLEEKFSSLKGSIE